MFLNPVWGWMRGALAGKSWVQGQDGLQSEMSCYPHTKIGWAKNYCPNWQKFISHQLWRHILACSTPEFPLLIHRNISCQSFLIETRLHRNTFGNRQREDGEQERKESSLAFGCPPSSPGLRMSPHGFRLQEGICSQELRHRQMEELDRGLEILHAGLPLPPPSRITLGKLLNLSVCSSAS